MLRKYILFILAAVCISCLLSCSNPADSGEDSSGFAIVEVSDGERFSGRDQ